MTAIDADRPRPTAGIPRRVQPEILDGLPSGSPAASASRRDLRILNALLGSHAWFRRELGRRFRAGERVLEIGAGTGELGRALNPIVDDVDGLDLCERPPGWAPSGRWYQADVREFRAWAEYPVVIANLFLHHFEREQLGQIGAQLGRHARVIVASEPLRRPRSARWFALICPLIRAHPVTRHDGRVSIAAGFRRDELARLLRLDPAVWSWRASETWLGASRLVAERRR